MTPKQQQKLARRSVASLFLHRLSSNNPDNIGDMTTGEVLREVHLDLAVANGAPIPFYPTAKRATYQAIVDYGPPYED
jgi:hypothetical protein